MNINKLATSFFIVGTLLAPAAVFAGDDRDADRSHPETYVKDSVITTKIKAKLANEKMASVMHVSVDTDDRGQVVLSGKVRTQEQADRALALARETEGVTSVKSKIKVRQDD